MRGIHTCCPEAPSHITINQTVLSIDSGEARFVELSFTGANFISNGGFVELGYTPLSRASTSVYLNSGAQRGLSDFTVSGSILTLRFTPEADDIVHVKFLSRLDGAALVESPVGTLVGHSGTPLPSGWLLMDGVTTVEFGTYPLLQTFLASNVQLTVEGVAHGVGDELDPYTLRLVLSSYFDPGLGTIVSGSTLIKHD